MHCDFAQIAWIKVLIDLIWSGMMARMARAEVFAPDEVAVVHVMNRVVRRCYLLGNCPLGHTRVIASPRWGKRRWRGTAFDRRV